MPVPGFAGRLRTQPKAGDVCSFSLGEKVRMRANQKAKSVEKLDLTPTLSSRRGGKTSAATARGIRH
jgi:hypothetical protein